MVTRSESATSISLRTRRGAAPRGARVTSAVSRIPPTPPEPDGLDDGSAAALLDAAEDILNAAGSRILAEVEAERESDSRGRGLIRRLFRRGE